MELVFVPHGQAEHTLNVPKSYDLDAPGLTQTGRLQAEMLREKLLLTEQDAVIVSPTRRTLQTAQIWCEGSNALRFVHPAVGPRQCPLLYDFRTLRCDKTMEPTQITEQYETFMLPTDVPDYVWLQGINTLPELLFQQWSMLFLTWCQRLEKEKVYVVTHDGTISSYIQHITGLPWDQKKISDEMEWIPLSV